MKETIETCPVCGCKDIIENDDGINKCAECSAVVSIDKNRTKTCVITDSVCTACEG